MTTYSQITVKSEKLSCPEVFLTESIISHKMFVLVYELQTFSRVGICEKKTCRSMMTGNFQACCVLWFEFINGLLMLSDITTLLLI